MNAPAILNVLDEVIVEYGRNGLVVWACESLRTVLGYNPDVVVGTHFRLPTVYADEADLDPVAQPDGWRELLRMPRADGSLVWMDVAVHHLYDNGQRTGTVVVAREPQSSVEGLRSQPDADIVQRLDSHNRTVWVSESVRGFTGWTPQELLGETELSRIHPADTSTAAEQLIAVHSGQAEVTVEVRLRHRNGTYLWWRVKAQRAEPDSPDSDILLFYRNIDAEVRHREEANRQLLLLRATIDSAPDPIVFVRPVWDTRGRVVELPIVAVNRQVVLVTGRRESALVGHPLVELLPGETAMSITRAAGQLQDDQQSLSMSGVAVGQAFGHYADLRLWCAQDVIGLTWVSNGGVPSSADAPVVDFTASVPGAAPDHWWRPVLNTSLDPCVVLVPVRNQSGRLVDFSYVDANHAACDYHQKSREQLAAQTLGGLLSGEQFTGLLPLLVDLAENGDPLIADDLAVRHESAPIPRRLDIRGVKVGDALLVSWRDVTDRVTSEARLAQSERRYRLLAENASEVVLQTGPDGVIEWSSPSVLQVLGYRPEDLVGRRVSDLLEPEEVQRLREEMAANVAAHRPDGERRLRIRTADGRNRWMSSLGHALIDDQGRVVGGVDALRDIHDEVVAQEALAASEARLSMLLDAMAEGVVVRDAHGVITRCNPAAEAILGLPADQIVGRTGPPGEWRGIHEDGSDFSPEDLPEVVALRSGRGVHAVVLGVPLPDGEVSWLHIDCEVLREGDDKEVTGVISTFVDITDRIRATRQIQLAEARYRRLADNATDFVVMTGEAGQLVWASPSIEQILGWRPDDLLGTTADDLLHPDDLALLPKWRRAADEGLTVSDRVRIRHSDGSYSWFSMSAHPVVDDPLAPNGRVAGYRDIQAEVEAEELLAASERRYRLLAETMTDLVEEYDASWYLVWASPSAKNMLGFSPDELVGSFAPNLIHPDDDTTDDRDRVDAGLNGNVADYRRRVRRLRADGSYVWVDSALSFRYDEAGKHVATYITSRDVDAEVRAEEELAQSEQRFSRMFTGHDAIMLLLDPTSGAIVDANRAASRYYGYSREQFASMNITDINMAPVEDVEEQMTAVVENRVNAFTFSHQLADGSIRTVEIHSSTIDDRGRLLLFSIVRDITDDLAARQELAASEQRYRLLAENATDFVLFADVDGTVKWVSPSTERLLGWRLGDVVGRPDESLMHPDDLTAGGEAGGDSAACTSTRRVRVRTAEGAWHWFQASSKPVYDDAGVLTGRVTGFQDVQAETEAREQLRQAHERLELVLDSSRFGLWDWDMRTGRTVFNQRWAHILGYDLAELTPTSIETWYELAHPDDLPVSQAGIEAHTAGEVDYYDVNVRMRHKDGHWVWVRDRGRIVERDDSGNPVRMTGTHEDVTAFKQATEALEASEQRFRAAMASTPVGMAVLNLDRTITQVNPALCALLGYDEQWLVGRKVSDIVDEADDVIDRSARTRLRRVPEQAVTVEHRMIRSDHARVWVQQAMNLVHGPGGRVTGYVSQFADITEAREARHRLRDLAGRDPLTDLLNRRELMAQLRSGDGTAGFALLFVDLDGLKQINDSYGHLVGDQVIRAQARRLRAVAGPGHLVARFGGDEFVVVLSGVTETAQAQALAQKIHEAARAAVLVGEQSIILTCSIGIALSTEGDLDAALAAADEAVYRAKRAGRDCTRVYGEFTQ